MRAPRLSTSSFVSCLVISLTSWACAPDAPVGSGSGIAGPPERFSVNLEWDAPTTDAAGAPLLDLQGYRLYVDTRSPIDRGRATAIDLAAVTRHTVSDLDAGTYVFAVAAVDTAGNESELSPEVSTTLEAGR